MNAQIERRAIPTLMGGQRRQQQPGYGHVQTLVDLLGDGFYLLYLLKHGSTPPEETRFFNSITALLAEFDRAAASYAPPAQTSRQPSMHSAPRWMKSSCRRISACVQAGNAAPCSW